MSGLFKHLISKVHACQEHGLLSHRLRPWRFVPPRERLIDPVGEAEVYLAYGRRQEALRVLRHAQREEPHNLEIKLLLLQTLAYLREQRRIHTMFDDDQPKDDLTFGRVAHDDFFGES